MSVTHRKDDEHVSPPSVSMVMVLISTFLDTTWRLFVPTIGGTILGIWADRTFDTRPIGTIIGVIAGAVLAFTLVYLQLRKVKI